MVRRLSNMKNRNKVLEIGVILEIMIIKDKKDSLYNKKILQ